jgi:hypothetical protein
MKIGKNLLNVNNVNNVNIDSMQLDAEKEHLRNTAIAHFDKQTEPDTINGFRLLSKIFNIPTPRVVFLKDSEPDKQATSTTIFIKTKLLETASKLQPGTPLTSSSYSNRMYTEFRRYTRLLKRR